MSPTEQEDLRAMLSRSLKYRCWRMITTGWCLGVGRLVTHFVRV